MKHILCFGDSNTWGFVPGSGHRYDEHTRWTGVLADALGPDWSVHEDGLNARTTVFTDPFKPYLVGLDTLPASLVSQKPLDILILSLGTNDLKYANAARSANGMEALIHRAQSMDVQYPAGTPVFKNGPKLLVISPILLDETLPSLNPYSDLAGGVAQSRLFPERFAATCKACGVEMLDAQLYAEPSKVDGIHMMPDAHQALGLAVAEKLRQMLTD